MMIMFVNHLPFTLIFSYYFIIYINFYLLLIFSLVECKKEPFTPFVNKKVNSTTEFIATLAEYDFLCRYFVDRDWAITNLHIQKLSSQHFEFIFGRIICQYAVEGGPDISLLYGPNMYSKELEYYNYFSG